MNFLPKIKRCPNCYSVNILKINGVSYDNNFKSLSDWTLKKKFNCRKCKINLGLFINNLNKVEKLIWVDLLNCSEIHSVELNKLQKNKNKYEEKGNKKEYLKVIKNIENIQNQIRLDQVKIKIKVKIQNRNFLV